MDGWMDGLRDRKIGDEIERRSYKERETETGKKDRKIITQKEIQVDRQGNGHGNKYDRQTNSEMIYDVYSIMKIMIMFHCNSIILSYNYRHFELISLLLLTNVNKHEVILAVTLPRQGNLS